MADYYTPTVVQPTIPTGDITPLERLLLAHIFDAEPDGDGLYLCSSEGPSTMLLVTRAEIEAALADSPPESAACKYVKEQLATVTREGDDLDLDMSGTSWEFFLQDIVRRSTTLDHITVVSWFTCSKMRPDGFGGMAVLITAESVKGKSTEDILCELQDEAENGSLLAAPGFGVHTLLTLSEQDVRAQIPQVIEANAPITKIGAADVTDADIRAACLITVDQTDLTEERGSAIFKTAVRAIHQAEQRLAAST